MSQDRRRRIERLFQAAVDRGEEERAAFLDRECGEDQALRAAVERLLRALNKALDSGFLS